ncbi:hypothetical protein FR943_13015 [Mycobacterium sp. TNTM28]|uniref:Nitroreductase domain-containing protein n=1 Tax=[Mycobacterium] fortunisiensis TaxID=2600579 RepID=A0ABS6KMB6_9MYCO|nr:nitroreductase family protein [[Mycobacterium] fortunisiensis]MBU9764757.1 hypothetical protein [[Mycobacterium] fortunisiensis]
MAQRSGAALDGADYLETTIIGFVDTALAAQNAVVTAESLGLGTVFVGVIRNDPEEAVAELNLPPRAVATFGLRRGFRGRAPARLRRAVGGLQQPLRIVGQLESADAQPGWPARSHFGPPPVAGAIGAPRPAVALTRAVS